MEMTTVTQECAHYYLGFMAHQDDFTHFEPSQSLVGRKREIPEKNHLTTHKQNLACLRCDLRQTWTHSGEMIHQFRAPRGPPAWS